MLYQEDIGNCIYFFFIHNLILPNEWDVYKKCSLREIYLVEFGLISENKQLAGCFKLNNTAWLYCLLVSSGVYFISCPR